MFDGSWNVCEAQIIEETISQELGLQDRVTFSDKMELFLSREVSSNVFNLLVEEVLELIDSKLIALGRFSWSFPSFDEVWDDNVLSGNLIGYRGNLVVFDNGSSSFVVDLSTLSGKGMVTWEE